MTPLPPPGPENKYLSEHAALLRRSFRALTGGRELIAPEATEAETARALYHAPFVVLSHDSAPDPIFNYGNRLALDLFELTWDELTAMPSRLTAEAPDREARARLLAEVDRRGFIDDYSGVRISRQGRRFRIARATVWNLTDVQGRPCGQAATFAEWQLL